jgi:hypothetical protein
MSPLSAENMWFVRAQPERAIANTSGGIWGIPNLVRFLNQTDVMTARKLTNE